jgi:hypothetical protein
MRDACGKLPERGHFFTVNDLCLKALKLGLAFPELDVPSLQVVACAGGRAQQRAAFECALDRQFSTSSSHGLTR